LSQNGDKKFILFYKIYDELHKERIIHEIVELDKNNHRFRAKNMEMINHHNGRKSILKSEDLIYPECQG